MVLDARTGAEGPHQVTPAVVIALAACHTVLDSKGSKGRLLRQASMVLLWHKYSRLPHLQHSTISNTQISTVRRALHTGFKIVTTNAKHNCPELKQAIW